MTPLGIGPQANSHDMSGFVMGMVPWSASMAYGGVHATSCARSFINAHRGISVTGVIRLYCWILSYLDLD